MATAALHSFNLFLTERLTAAAGDIFSFVERTLEEYQEEVQRTRQENHRLQRLLDMVYQPHIRLHRADSEPMDVPPWTKKVCSPERNVQQDSPLTDIVPVTKEEAEPWNSALVINVSPERCSAKHFLTHNIKVEECEDAELPSCQAEGGTTRSLPGVSTVEEATGRTFISSPIYGWLNHSQEATAACMDHVEKPFSCPICGNRYKIKSHIKEHMRTHTGERPYSCYICGKSFYRSSTMSKHARIKHRENKAFRCTICSLRFPVLPLLKQHLRDFHDAVFPL